MFLLFSHTLNETQKIDAKNSLGITEFVALPSNLQEKFSNVPPEISSLDEVAKPFYEFLQKSAKKGDYVLIQGDFGLTFLLVNFCLKNGLIPNYATTKRDVLMDENGVKKTVFHHERFRKYNV